MIFSTEKSKLAYPGPRNGSLAVFPKVPGLLGANAAVLNHSCNCCAVERLPGSDGSPVRFARSRLTPLAALFEPVEIPKGKPSCQVSIPDDSHPLRMCWPKNPSDFTEGSW